MNFLHTNIPKAILISIGPVNIYWYGLFIVSGLLLAMLTAFKLADYYNIKKDTIIDLTFWLIIGGIAGARIYHIGLELPYYLDNPLEMFKVWHGGLAIHGGITAGLIIIWVFSKRHKINFWLLGSIIVPGLALAQAVGRWGNYFNQEIFGKQTDMPWGIPIEIAKRPAEYIVYTYFHPTFLYISIGNFLIFVALIYFHAWIIKNKKHDNFYYALCAASYLIMYSILRFSLEFVRIDRTPEILGLRFPQIVSIFIILVISSYIFYAFRKNTRPKQ